MVIPNAPFLSRFARERAPVEIDTYVRVLTQRILPAFTDEEIRKEAGRVFDETVKLQVDIYGGDPADFFPDAETEAYACTQSMQDMKQGILNSFAIAIYHRFEQQFSASLRMATPGYKKITSNKEEVAKGFQALDLDVTKLKGWSAIDEFRLIANCSKHAEGHSCDELRKNRPDLFANPRLLGAGGNPEWQALMVEDFTEEPLAGQGLYITEDELDKKIKAIKCFWNSLADTVEAMSRE